MTLSNKHLILVLFTMLSGKINAALYFDPAALAVDGVMPSNVDLSVFEHGGQLEGEYRVKIFLNDAYIDERDIKFVRIKDKLYPTLKKLDYIEMGVSDKNVIQLKGMDDNAIITDIKSVMPMAETKFNFIQQRLDVSIPQAYIAFTADDYVSPTLWDDGINALFSTYDVSYNHTGAGVNNDSTFLNFNNGINILGWKLRNNSTFSETPGSSGRWQNLSSYVQRDLSKIKSQLVLGQTYTSGDIFDSFAYDGIRIFSDDTMLPYSQQGISPVINGISNSQATVIIRQNGYIIKQVSVPPGPFSIRDINAINSGTLEVTIRESNGSERKFSQPWTSVPGMQREGHLRFAYDMGKYISNDYKSIDSKFIQGQLQYGVNPSFTIYGGTQLAQNYISAQVGAAHSIGMLGALSLDITGARADLSREQYNNNETGQSYRVQYAKFIDETNTNISISGYRFSTKGYYDFNEFNQFDPDSLHTDGNKRSRVQFIAYQSMFGYGSLFVNIYRQDYWGGKNADETYAAGYSFNLWRSNFNIGLNSTKYKSNKDERDTQLTFNVSVPFSIMSTKNWLSYGITHDNNNKTNNNISLFGSFDNEGKWSYNSRFYNAKDNDNSGYNIGTVYKGNSGTIGGEYSSDNYSNQLNVNAQGSILVHKWGVTLANRIDDSVVLVRAPGASNTRILGSSVSTNSNGYAVVNNVTAYHRNRIALDTSTLPDGVDVETDVKVVVPTRGAIALADIKTFTGYQALIKLSYKGKSLPFGVPVSLIGSKSTMGIIDEKGEVYMHGLSSEGKIEARWGRNGSGFCVARYSIPEHDIVEIKKLLLSCY